MKYNQNKRLKRMFYAASASLVLLTGFTSMAAETAETVETAEKTVVTGEILENTVVEIRTAAEKAHEDYLIRIEEEKRQAEIRAEEERAREEAAREQELLAALIFCEAGNQPYEGQVAVGAVVMNRVRSSEFPDTITDVIYQSGQFTPAMTGWLDSVLSSDGYTDSAVKAAADALSGSNPVGDCLYFSTGGKGYQLGDHFFR